MRKVIAICVIQGTACFASTVADYLVYGEIKCPMCLGDILILEIRSLLQQVMKIQNNELQGLLSGEAYDFRFDCDNSKSIPLQCPWKMAKR